jgi:hypothetical protein
MEEVIEQIESVTNSIIGTMNDYAANMMDCDKDIDILESKIGQDRCGVDPFWEEDRLISLKEDLEDTQGERNKYESIFMDEYKRGCAFLEEVEEAINRARDELEEAYYTSTD